MTTLSNQQIGQEIAQWEAATVNILSQEYVDGMKKDFAYIRFPGGSGHNDERVL